MDMVRLYVGLIRAGREGGVYVTERRFLDECRRRNDVAVDTFEFGSRRSDESTLVRIFRAIYDVIGYAVRVRLAKRDIVQINSAFDRRGVLRDVWYALASRLMGARLFIKYHGSDAALAKQRSALLRRVIAVTWKYAAGVGVLSTEEKLNLEEAGCRPETCFVVKNVVDCERFQGTRRNGSTPERLLFIARFIPSKGVVEVIHAMRTIVDAGWDVQLDCVGDGILRQEVGQLVMGLGLKERVHFPGYIPESETTPYYLRSSILLFPTRHGEGFSMTVFQAVAAGLPIITTRIRAAADYLREPDNCLWVEPDNPAMLAEKAIRLLGDRALRSAMSRSNRELAQRFSAPLVTEEYLTVYRRLMPTSA